MAPPSRQAGPGLYDPTYEHDACGVAFVARLGAPASHEVIARALWALEHLEHRGAEGADADTGDGAGILIQLPDAFLRDEVPFDLPEPGRYGVAVCFLPDDEFAREHAERLIVETVEAEGQHVLGWRDVPVDPAHCGTAAAAAAPVHPPAVRRRRRRRRGPGRARAPPLRDPAGHRARRAARPGDRHAVEQDGRLQGDAHRPSAVAVLPRPQGRAGHLPHGARPLALLDQHLPELGARPPVPDARPQRRDQHAARQPQLAPRPRAHARLAAVRRRHRQDPRAAARRHLRLGLARRPDGAARARRPLARARDLDAHPRGLPGAARAQAGGARLLRLPLLARSSPGTAPPPSPSPTAA